MPSPRWRSRCRSAARWPSAHLPPTRRAGSKPFLIEGLNADTGEWEAPAAGQRYREFQAGVQLANRSGALNEIEYSEFVQKIRPLPRPSARIADFPDMLEVVARARELDAFAGDHDAQLAVHLHARTAAWSVGYIQQHAARHGFVPGMVPGRLVLPADEEGAPPVLTLSFDPQAALADDPNQAAVREVTLSLRRAADRSGSASPSSPGRRVRRHWPSGMDAAIVDDDGQPLDAARLRRHRQRARRLYQELEARDLAAGSGAARRLFS